MHNNPEGPGEAVGALGDGELVRLFRVLRPLGGGPAVREDQRPGSRRAPPSGGRCRPGH